MSARLALVFASFAWMGCAASSGRTHAATEASTAPPSTSTSQAPPSAPVVAQGPAAPRPATTPEGCAEANPERACRRWQLRATRCSTGTPPGYVDTNACVCDLCDADADCAAAPGGRCVSFGYADRCPSPRNLCVYPADPCYPGGHCAPGLSCMVGPNDAPACLSPAPPSA